MGYFRKFISTFEYLIGCLILIPASIALINSSLYLYESIFMFIVACAFLLKASLIDLYHVFAISNLNNKTDIINDVNHEERILDGESKEKKSSTCLNIFISMTYVLGGIFFEAGSILYWPTFTTGTLGTWIFRFGSIFYLIGTFNLLNMTLKQYEEKKKDRPFFMFMSSLIFYALGSLTYILGGVLSEMHYKLSGEVWLVGSVFFSLGALFTFIETCISY